MAPGGEALGPGPAGWRWLTVSPGAAVRQSVSQGWSHPRACWGGVSFRRGSLTRGEPVLALGQDPPLLSRWAVRGAASVSVQKAVRETTVEAAVLSVAEPRAPRTPAAACSPRPSRRWEVGRDPERLDGGRGDTGAVLEAGYQNQFGNISEILLGTFRNKF